MSTAVDEREAALAAFQEVATVEEAAKVAELDDAVVSVVTAAQSIEVRNAQEAEHATEFLSRVAGEKRRAEQARRFLVDPINRHVKAINARFKTTTEPLEQADRIVREKVLGYQREQERRRAEEQARLDAERRERERQAEEERRRVEAEARAEREAAAREAARRETEAREAERRRRDELARATSDLEREVAALDDDTLKMAVLSPPADRARAAGAELDRRRAARIAKEEAAAAREREEEARLAEQAVQELPPAEVPRAVAAPAAPLRSGSGSVANRKVWRGTVLDEARVPRAYLVVDQRLINQAVRDGVREIPGVLIKQVDGLAVRAR